jgi:hypothetical protein
MLKGTVSPRELIDAVSSGLTILSTLHSDQGDAVHFDFTG